MSQSNNAQIEATNPQASVWVAANAGTGKTRVLTQRVIRLLLEGTSPERILCLTFTKAAAAEMANRLFSTLGDWATWPDRDLKAALEAASQGPVKPSQLQLARRLFARALETPGGLKIQTIHAFCERLLARFPLEAQVAAHFEVLDERTVTELMARARDDLLTHIDRDGAPELSTALETIVTRTSDTQFDLLLREVAAKRKAILDLLERSGRLAGAIDLMRKKLGLESSETLEAILDEARTGFEARRTELENAVEILRSGSTNDVKRGKKISDFLASDGGQADFKFYCGAYLRGDGEPLKRLATANLRADNLELEGLLRSEQERVCGILEKLKSSEILENTGALLTIADYFLQRYDIRKKARAGLDFDDLISHTNDLLKKSDAAAWVLYKLDGGLDHILVDEAQDTSPDQWAVIEALGEEFFSGLGAHAARAPTEARSVFAVGDQKQSIYSFQGADSAKFAEMREKFRTLVESGAESWSQVDLDRSFRSTHPILSAVDEVFSNDETAAYLTASERYISHITHRQGQAGLVELWPAIGPSEQSPSDPWDAPLDQIQVTDPRAVLAARIGDMIAGWLENGETLISQHRPIEPGDIMILVRRRDAFMEEMIRSLKKREIPVSGADRMVLTDHISVMDLIALGNFALLPHDDLNLATVLKSPFVSMTEEELFDLAYERDGSLWNALSDKTANSGSTIFSKTHDALSRIVRRAERVRPFDFYQNLLDLPFREDQDGRSGRELMLRRLGQDAADPINELLNLTLLYERMATPTLQGFLQWLQTGDVQLKRELERGKNEVRVMTVHGAKGLESRVVFLPDTCDMPDGRHDPQLIEAADGLLLWPGRKDNDNQVARAARDELAEARRAEYYRLLYVAMTRAEDRLYVAGYHGSRSPAPGCWHKKIKEAIEPSAQKVTTILGEEGLRLECDQTAAVKPRTENEREPIKDGEMDLPAWLKTNAPKEDVHVRYAPPHPIDNSSYDREHALFSPLVGGERSRFERGRLIHKLLQYLPDIPQTEHARAAQHYLDILVPHLSLDIRHEIASQTLTVLTHEQFAPIFGPGSKAEVSVIGWLAAMPDEPLNCRVDRLLIEDDRVLIVDYKTNRSPPQTSDEVDMVYLRQMACYRALLQDIYPGRSIDCALLWIDGPRLMPLPARLLDGASPHMSNT